MSSTTEGKQGPRKTLLEREALGCGLFRAGSHLSCWPYLPRAQQRAWLCKYLLNNLLNEWVYLFLEPHKMQLDIILPRAQSLTHSMYSSPMTSLSISLECRICGFSACRFVVLPRYLFKTKWIWEGKGGIINFGHSDPQFAIRVKIQFRHYLQDIE